MKCQYEKGCSRDFKWIARAVLNGRQIQKAYLCAAHIGPTFNAWNQKNMSSFTVDYRIERVAR